MKAKLTREAWLQAGFDALDSQGHTAVSAQALARRLNVTRGSFYHHFGSRSDFVAQLLLRWEEEHTVAVLEDVRSAGDPGSRLERYIAVASGLQPGREVAFRAWAEKDSQVRTVLQRVEGMRRAFALESMQALVQPGVRPETVGAFADLAYLAFIGMLHGVREDHQRFARFFQSLKVLGQGLSG